MQEENDGEEHENLAHDRAQHGLEQLIDGADAHENSLYVRIAKSEFLGPYSLLTLAPTHHHLPPLQAQFSSNYLAGRTLDAGSHIRITIPATCLCRMPDTP